MKWWTDSWRRRPLLRHRRSGAGDPGNTRVRQSKGPLWKMFRQEELWFGRFSRSAELQQKPLEAIAFQFAGCECS